MNRLWRRLLTPLVISVGFCTFPHITHAAVFISEIAWMGTSVSANDEWIELANNADAAVDISGWTLVAQDGSPSIALTGTIPAHGFFLLERSNDDAVPQIVANVIYAGALGNTGEVLRLSDASGALVDEVSMSYGWIAGDNSTKDTMQKAGNNWVTASPTPKAPNATKSVVQNESEEDDDGDTTDTATHESQISSEELSSNGLKAKQNLTLYAGRERTVVVGQTVRFDGALTDTKHNYIIDGVDFVWNFGDGTTGTSYDALHTYTFPGTYVVILHATYQGVHYIARTEVDVVASHIDMVEAGPGFVTLKNDDAHEVNLSGFVISHKEGTVYIPEDTIMLPDSTLRLSHPFSDGHVQVLLAESDTPVVSGATLRNVDDITDDLTYISERLAYVSAHMNVATQSHVVSPKQGSYTETTRVSPTSPSDTLPAVSSSATTTPTDDMPTSSSVQRATAVLYTETHTSVWHRLGQFLMRVFTD